MTNTKLKQSAPLLYTANPNIIYLRDGEVVVYRRNASPLHQCRHKLADGKYASYFAMPIKDRIRRDFGE